MEERSRSGDCRRPGPNVEITNRTGRSIRTVDDWFRHAPPRKGVAHWKDCRSAKELAKAWLRPSMPRELWRLFKGCPKFSCFRPDTVIPEYAIRLDQFGGDRNADLLLVGNAAGGRSLATIEAKADEPFADLVGRYHDQMMGRERSNVPERLKRLAAAVLGRGLDDKVRQLRYQLLHGTAATLIEAKKKCAVQAAFVVCEFRSAHTDASRLARNADDWAAFLSLLVPAAKDCDPCGQLFGPICVPGNPDVPADIPLYLGKVSIILPWAP